MRKEGQLSDQLQSYQKVHDVMSGMARSVHACAFNRDLPQPDEKPATGDTFFGNPQHMAGVAHMDVAREKRLEFNRPSDELQVWMNSVATSPCHF